MWDSMVRALRVFFGQHKAISDCVVIVLFGICTLGICISFDFYEKFYEFSAQHESWQVDDTFIGFVVIGWCGFIFGIRRILDLRREVRSRRRAEKAAVEMASQDALTKLPNRRGLTANYSLHKEKYSHFFLVIFDIDGFKSVNDVYGHSFGDRLLREIADSIRKVLPERDFACRLGGDEFALILRSVKTRDDAQRLLDQLVVLISRPMVFDSVRLATACTFGVATYPNDGEDLSSLLRRADLALYQGKHDGKNTIRFFNSSRDSHLEEQSQTAQWLREALDGSYLSLAYQPIVTVEEERIVGFEALARLYHPLHGEIPPSKFIPAAERSGLMREVTNLLLERACKEAQSWPESFYLAFNLSALDLRDENLVLRVQSVLQRTGLAPQRLELEVTETAIIGNVALARMHIENLRAMGICVSMDDFGTGYSSLAQLSQLNFSKLKIDRSFISTVLENDKNGRIVKAIIHLSEGLSLPAVAEGVETREQAQWLTDSGCSLAQGFLFNEPLTEVKLRALVSFHSGSGPDGLISQTWFADSVKSFKGDGF
jgi:diguanylate cyclase (GGDEF)-like protein